MSEPVKVTINGKVCEAQKGEYILEVARRNQILIPSFCHHEALPGLGCCRVCVAEVNEGGKVRVVVSCVYPLEKDCEVYTESEKIKGIRRTILSMLRGRAPEGGRLASLCKMYGVPDENRYTVPSAALADNAGIAAQGGVKDRLASACILCGLCVEACDKLGTGAISAVGRGTGKKISTPYDEASPDCVGCGSCAAVCPTGAIECVEENGSRAIWGQTFELVRCENCGRPFATREELAHSARRIAAESGAPPLLCENCRRKKSGDVMAAVYGIRV